MSKLAHETEREVGFWTDEHGQGCIRLNYDEFGEDSSEEEPADTPAIDVTPAVSAPLVDDVNERTQAGQTIDHAGQQLRQHPEPETGDETLVLIGQARDALAQARTIEEAKKIIDIAAMGKLYAQRLGLAKEAVQEAIEVRIRAERKMGELLQQTQRSTGSRGQLAGKDSDGEPVLEVTREDRQTKEPPTLSVLGISKNESSRAQKLAAIPKAQFEDRLQDLKDTGDVSLKRVLRQKSPHVAKASGNTEWYTPKEIIDAAHATLGHIELDPTSCEAANEVVQAERFYSIADDALQQVWQAKTVFMNPPYQKRQEVKDKKTKEVIEVVPGIGDFVDRLLDHFKRGDIKEATTLTNNATETKWGQRLLREADAVCFVDGRVSFWRTDGDSDSPLQGQMICYFGEDPETFCIHFEELGFCVIPQTQWRGSAMDSRIEAPEDLHALASQAAREASALTRGLDLDAVVREAERLAATALAVADLAGRAVREAAERSPTQCPECGEAATDRVTIHGHVWLFCGACRAAWWIESDHWKPWRDGHEGQLGMRSTVPIGQRAREKGEGTMSQAQTFYRAKELADQVEIEASERSRDIAAITHSDDLNVRTAEATETDAWATVEPAAKLVVMRDAIGFQPEEGETP